MSFYICKESLQTFAQISTDLIIHLLICWNCCTIKPRWIEVSLGKNFSVLTAQRKRHSTVTCPLPACSSYSTLGPSPLHPFIALLSKKGSETVDNTTASNWPQREKARVRLEFAPRVWVLWNMWYLGSFLSTFFLQLPATGRGRKGCQSLNLDAFGWFIPDL